MNWKYTEPTGPTISPGWKPDPAANFPYLPDERTQEEIDQQRFDEWQQEYEILKSNDEC